MSATADSAALTPVHRRSRFGSTTLAGIVVWTLVAVFFLNLFLLVATVVIDSFAKGWFTTWLPTGYTFDWYSQAWDEFNLTSVIIVTAEVAAAVVLISLLVGVPAAYALARRNFPGKQGVMVLFLLPILVPTITYGIPLATVLYRVRLAGSLWGVILANLVPAIPFVILVMIPFVEQIDSRVESAARMCGASTMTIFLRILGPLLIPGVLASAILVLVRTVGMFDLTFLTAGSDSQTLVVVLYASVFGAGIRPPQEVDAMAVVYTLSMLILLVMALRFVDPTQLVTRVGGRD